MGCGISAPRGFPGTALGATGFPASNGSTADSGAAQVACDSPSGRAQPRQEARSDDMPPSPPSSPLEAAPEATHHAAAAAAEHPPEEQAPAQVTGSVADADDLGDFRSPADADKPPVLEAGSAATHPASAATYAAEDPIMPAAEGAGYLADVDGPEGSCTPADALAAAADAVRASALGAVFTPNA